MSTVTTNTAPRRARKLAGQCAQCGKPLYYLIGMDVLGPQHHRMLDNTDHTGVVSTVPVPVQPETASVITISYALPEDPAVKCESVFRTAKMARKYVELLESVGITWHVMAVEVRPVSDIRRWDGRSL